MPEKPITSVELETVSIECQEISPDDWLVNQNINQKDFDEYMYSFAVATIDKVSEIDMYDEQEVINMTPAIIKAALCGSFQRGWNAALKYRGLPLD